MAEELWSVIIDLPFTDLSLKITIKPWDGWLKQFGHFAWHFVLTLLITWDFYGIVVSFTVAIDAEWASGKMKPGEITEGFNLFPDLTMRLLGILPMFIWKILV